MSDTASLHTQTSNPISSSDAMAAHQQYDRSQFGDTTFTKLFVGGLAWDTPTEEMRKYFEQFGDILEAVIITDKINGKSKGYGFVTFCDEESARRACAEPNPVIDGRRANCNIASQGRTRPSPPRGRDGGGGRARQGGASTHGGGVPAAGPPSLAAHAPPLMYPSYGYQTYSTPDYGYHHGTLYNPQLQQQAQYYQQLYGTSSSMGSPYYYGYSPRSAFSSPQLPNHQLSSGSAGPSYLYYPTTTTHIDVSFSGYRRPQQPATIRQPFPSPNDSQTQQHTSSESTAGVVRNSESSNSQGKN